METGTRDNDQGSGPTSGLRTEDSGLSGDRENPELRTQNSGLVTSTQHSAPNTQSSVLSPPSSHRHRPRPQLLVLLVVVLAAAGWWGYTQLSVSPTRGITASGTIEAEEVSIASEVPGRVVQLLADEGDQVKAGDVLVKLDDSLPRLQLKMAPISDRAPLELQLDKMSIKSPLDGIVARRSIRVGEVASPVSTLMVVTQLDRVNLTLYVPERKIGRVKVGQKVEVQVDSYPKEIFPGQVTFVANRAEFTPRNVQTQQDRLNLVFAVKVEIPSPDLRLKPGMPADATILD